MAGGHKQWTRLGDNTLPTEDASVGLGHIVPRKVYNSVFAALLVLTGLTVLVAALDLGDIALGVAIIIATFKAALVTLFFMHLNWENRLAWAIVIYPIFVFILILGGTLGDSAIKEPTIKAAKQHTTLETTAEAQEVPASAH